MKNCQTIIFSRNRSLQLHLCLSTLLNHCKDILEVSNINVLYRNDPEYDKSYETLMSEFPMVNFVKEENFKNDLLKLVSNETNISYVTFVVDDTVFTEDFSLKEATEALNDNPRCLGFSFRLGKNTKYCFPLDKPQNIPDTRNVVDDILMYDWQKAEHDFSYGLELSSSLYYIENIIEILSGCMYDSPNSLESCMSGCYIEDKPNLLMFGKSVAFSAPLNLVQSTHPNRNANFNPDTFRLMYEKGLRFDSKQFDGYVSNAAHEIPQEINVVDTR